MRKQTVLISKPAPKQSIVFVVFNAAELNVRVMQIFGVLMFCFVLLVNDYFLDTPILDMFWGEIARSCGFCSVNSD